MMCSNCGRTSEKEYDEGEELCWTCRNCPHQYEIQDADGSSYCECCGKELTTEDMV